MQDIKQLFKKYRITYRDSGKNVSRGNIVVSCPFCNKSDFNKDLGEHLDINTATGQYYCFRNPRHRGNVIAYLFKALGIPTKEFGNVELKESTATYGPDKNDYSAFKYFEPACDNREAISYLESRLFLNPTAIAQQFDLRVSNQGEWAGRLIIPLTIGWTGRAMRDHISLRYDAFTNEDGFFLYKHNSTSAIIFEGALDAMRVASVSNQFDVIGKCRMSLSWAILVYLREQQYSSIYVAPDATVSYLTRRNELEQVKTSCKSAVVEPIKMLEGRKDFCETPESDVRQMIYRIGYHDELPALRI